MDVASELNRGVLPAAELRDRLGVSPATLMRAVRDAGAQVVRIGKGRATRYGARQTWPTLQSSRFPLFRVDDRGEVRLAGELITLASRQTVWMPDGIVSEGLPIELADARPSGFLGRLFAATHADLHLPSRLADWSDHHMLNAMAQRGEDLPGNLIVGDESFARWQALDRVARTRTEYPALADATIAGHPPGSSAGGERPKFGVFAEGRHVLVKFAARGGSADAVARRWSDLLVLEALTLQVISSHGLATAACADVVDSERHRFLESERFDRVGERGRLAVLSLAAVHDDPAHPWARAATILRDAGRLTDEDARRLQALEAFGALTGNTDRHQFNVVFFVEETGLRLAPAFDHVSMFYAPSNDGQVPLRPYPMPYATADTLDVWNDARIAAREFWERANDDTRVSADLRRLCGANAKAV